MLGATEVSDRTQFIGGTDIAGILGLSRYKTALSVWAEKTGQVVPEPTDSVAADLGTYLEEYVARRFTKVTGLKVQRANERRVHPKHPHFAAQVDRLVVDTDELLECKTASAWLAKAWVDDEIPADYICQVMWQLACSGRKRGHIAVLIGNQDFKVKVIERDPVMIAEMLKRASAFWDEFVVPKVMPGQISAKDSKILYDLFPNAAPESQVDLGDEGARIVEMRNAMYEDKILLEDNIAKANNELKAMLKDNELGIAGKWKVSWKNQKRKAYTKVVEATEFRAFSIRELKEPNNG